MHYSPECYIEGYKTLSLDSGLINKILKEANSFVHKIRQTKSIHYEHRPGEMRQLSTSETKKIVTEVLNIIVTYIRDDIVHASNQVQLQVMLGDIRALKIWKACFGKYTSADEKIKTLAHNLLVDNSFLDEGPLGRVASEVSSSDLR